MKAVAEILQDFVAAPPARPDDLRDMLPRGERHPNDRPLGPIRKPGRASAQVNLAGRTIATAGDVEYADVTFSVAKSYLSALAGIAFRDRLITDLDAPVADTIHDGGFSSAQNARITWRHLLQQTSEWEGELFGIPDWIDRGRAVGTGAGPGDGTVGGNASGHRTLQAPGSFWEYNDVRVNRLSLCLLRLFREPLPDVLRREILGPIGASNHWQWHGYETSWIELGDTRVQSVSGGTHWGGGLWISTQDHARFARLYAAGGRHGARQIIPAEWIDETRKPCALNPGYGFLWWRNHDSALSTVAPASTFAARGAGGHVVFVHPDAEVEIVLRWSADGRSVIDSILRAMA